MSVWAESHRAAYETMTPYEISDLALTLRESLNTDVFNIVTLMFAYLLHKTESDVEKHCMILLTVEDDERKRSEA